ncbi:hypothetical protein, partial [Falsiroseomonas oryziterrae]|uniref:hypothetical protein n=1 Tax=Falsiroseomonas oryziterrae TaxID=2911368 RepID=UPI001F2CB8D1
LASPAIASPPLLRIALLGDAAPSAAMRLLLAGAAGPLAGLLGLPQALLLGAGLVLIPYAGLVAALGRSAAPSRNAVRVVIAVNVIWVADSLLLLALPAFAPTALGVAFVLAQAMAVVGFAALQAIALRRGAPVTA